MPRSLFWIFEQSALKSDFVALAKNNKIDFV